MSYIPVLIVGAGPSGLAMACELRRHGIPFRLIDKKPEATKTSNAAAIQSRTLEIFHQMGIADRFLARGLRCQGVSMHLGGTTDSIIFDQIHSPYPYILMLPQSETESILSDRLMELGGTVERSTELNRIHAVDGRYEVSITRGDHNEVLACDWLLACDGAHSMVRECFSIPFLGDDLPENFLVADLTLETALPLDRIQLFSNTGKLLGLFPLGKYYRIVANAIPAVAPFRQADIDAMVQERTQGKCRVSELIWASPFWIHSRMAKTMRHQQVFFVGDSAHIHSPVGAQGMNTGIQDAHNLAWKLGLVLRGEGSVKLLQSYEQERQPVIRQIVESTERMTKAMVSRWRIMNWARRLLFFTLSHSRRLQEKLSNRVTQVSIRYETSPIIQYETTSKNKFVLPGLRAPDVIISGTMHLHDYLKHPRHTVLIFTGDAASGRANEEAKVLFSWLRECYDPLVQAYIVAKNPIDLESSIILDPDGKLHACYGASESLLCIIRPDGVIGLVQNLLDEEAIQSYFSRLLLQIKT